MALDFQKPVLRPLRSKHVFAGFQVASRRPRPVLGGPCVWCVCACGVCACVNVAFLHGLYEKLGEFLSASGHSRPTFEQVMCV